MKRLLSAALGLAATIPANQALASNWYNTGTSTDNLFFTDTESAQVTGVRKVVWEWNISKTISKTGVKSAKSRVEYHCSEGWYATKYSILFDVFGKSILSGPIDGRINYPAPDSIGERMFKFVCRDGSVGDPVSDPEAYAAAFFAAG